MAQAMVTAALAPAAGLGSYSRSRRASPFNVQLTSSFQRSAWRTSLVSSRSTGGVRASAIDVSKIVPQGDRVLIRLASLAEQSAGGVLLPKAAVKYERYLAGEILATGSAVEKVEKGNKVLVKDVNAYEVNLGTSDKLCFAKAEDLLAVVE